MVGLEVDKKKLDNQSFFGSLQNGLLIALLIDKNIEKSWMDIYKRSIFIFIDQKLDFETLFEFNKKNQLFQFFSK